VSKPFHAIFFRSSSDIDNPWTGKPSPTSPGYTRKPETPVELERRGLSREMQERMADKRNKTKAEKRHLRAMRERERQLELIEGSRERLLSRVVEAQWEKGRQIQIVECNTVKMSEVIIDFAEPLLKQAKSFEDQRKALEAAIILWNISMLPEEKQVEHTLRLGTDFWGEPSETNMELYRILAFMLARRHSQFPGIRRIVQDFEVLEQPGGFHLNVAHYQLSSKPKKAGAGRARS
jgi:hypothetical protein